MDNNFRMISSDKECALNDHHLNGKPGELTIHPSQSQDAQLDPEFSYTLQVCLWEAQAVARAAMARGVA